MMPLRRHWSHSYTWLPLAAAGVQLMTSSPPTMLPTAHSHVSGASTHGATSAHDQSAATRLVSSVNTSWPGCLPLIPMALHCGRRVSTPIAYGTSIDSPAPLTARIVTAISPSGRAIPPNKISPAVAPVGRNAAYSSGLIVVPAAARYWRIPDSGSVIPETCRWTRLGCLCFGKRLSASYARKLLNLARVMFGGVASSTTPSE